MEAHIHLAAMQACLGEPDILTKPEDMAPYCIDQRRRYKGNAWAVLLPRSVAQVQTILRYCHTHNIPITPQGGNTGLCGGATPLASLNGKGFLLAMGRLNRVREVNTADNTITVDAGMILAQVQQAARAADRYFPLSLASEGTCQIGGNIACNAGGLNVVRYGTARDLVLGLEYVLPNGTLVSHLQPLHKNTTGYELRQQIIGSEGTLAVITGATLKLYAQPQSVQTAWIGLNSIQAAVALLGAVKNRFAERLSSFELISDQALALSAQYSQHTPPVAAAWHVLLELTDSLPQAALDDPLIEVLSAGNWLNAVIAQSDTERQHLWLLRENISAAQRHLGASIKHDIAVPIAQVADFIETCAQAMDKLHPNTQLVIFGHLGDGSLHYNVFLPHVLNNAVYDFETDINATVYEQVLAHHGTIAAEHGIGQLKTHWLTKVRSTEEIAWMRAQKDHFDPHHVLNPGKVIPATD